MSDIKLGAQLYTLRDYIQNYEDAEKTFAYLDSIGINTIQISAIGPIEPEKVAYLVDKYSMDVCVTHTSFDRMLSDTEAVVREHKMIHCDTLGVGCMPGGVQRQRRGRARVYKAHGRARKKASRYGDALCLS